jgi:L-aminopeptidase/D-esterase-like protein
MARLVNAITDVPGIQVGHAQNDEALTGVTVVLCSEGAVGGMDQRGGAPGTRETDALRPMHLVQKAHAIVLSGGSAFGLDAASGAVKWLEERNIGFDTRAAKVPIVPAAILYDLAIGRADVRPDPAMGYAACEAAHQGPVAEGNVGAGCGATVGKIYGMGQAMKAGLGTASIDLGGGLIVGAIVAVNAFGDVIEPSTGQIIAGARKLNVGATIASAVGLSERRNEPGVYPEAPHFADTLAVLQSLVGKTIMRFTSGPLDNTVIGVIAANADLNKEQVNKVAQMAHDGLARTIRPAHTMLDGDTLFALATGGHKADVNIIGAYAAEAMARAIIRAVLAAQPSGGLPSASSFRKLPEGTLLIREKRADDVELSLNRTDTARVVHAKQYRSRDNPRSSRRGRACSSRGRRAGGLCQLGRAGNPQGTRCGGIVLDRRAPQLARQRRGQGTRPRDGGKAPAGRHERRRAVDGGRFGILSALRRHAHVLSRDGLSGFVRGWGEPDGADRGSAVSKKRVVTSEGVQSNAPTVYFSSFRYTLIFPITSKPSRVYSRTAPVGFSASASRPTDCMPR